MSKIDDGGAAFPEHRFESYGSGAGRHLVHGGMSLRDWFAGQALAGLAVHEKPYDNTIDAMDSYCRSLAVKSYRLADAMIKERGGEDV